jgi:pyroglutamyl-peptidase
VKDPSHKTPVKMPRVRLAVHPEPIRVNYETVRTLVPTFWDDPARQFDLALHIGMAGPPVKYSIERRGHRDGYKFRDVDDNLLGDEERREREGGKWIWDGVPEELLTDLDIEDIYKRWLARSPVRLCLAFRAFSLL